MQTGDFYFGTFGENSSGTHKDTLTGSYIDLDGGPGDDVITSTEGYYQTSTGGAGDDTYLVTIETPSDANYDPDTYTSGVVNLGVALVVTDFEAGSDLIAIDFEPPLGGTNLQLSQIVSGDINDTDASIEITFTRETPIEGEINEVTLSILLQGGAGLTEADWSVSS
jgi:hypothetical protein